MPGYIKSTYIDQTTIRSPVIEGGEFYGEEFNIIAGGDFGSFNLYGPFGSSRYHMLAIEYFEGNAPLINIYSPCGGYITIGPVSYTHLGLARNMPTLIQSVVDLLMSFFSGIVSALGSIDTDALLKGIAGIGLLSGIMVALGALAGLIPSAMVGVLGLGVVIAELAIVLAAVGALAQIPGLEWLISEGGRCV